MSTAKVRACLRSVIMRAARSSPMCSHLNHSLQPTVGESLTKAKDNVVAAVHTSTAPPTAGDQLKAAATKV